MTPTDDLLVRNIGHLVTMNAERAILRDAWLLARSGFVATLVYTSQLEEYVQILPPRVAPARKSRGKVSGRVACRESSR